jgi:hypothetical protein
MIHDGLALVATAPREQPTDGRGDDCADGGEGEYETGGFLQVTPDVEQAADFEHRYEQQQPDGQMHEHRVKPPEELGDRGAFASVGRSDKR